MSKLYQKYLHLKSQDDQSYYLFKNGIFYIFLDQDAIEVSQRTGLKCTKLNDEVVKCGFPVNSLEKHMKKLEELNFSIVLVDSMNLYSNVQEVIVNDKRERVLRQLSEIDLDHISPMEGYLLLRKMKEELVRE